jgi:hypothetical protein
LGEARLQQTTPSRLELSGNLIFSCWDISKWWLCNPDGSKHNECHDVGPSVCGLLGTYVSEECTASIFRTQSDLKMEAVCSSEAMSAYKSTPRYSREGHQWHLHCCEKLRFHITETAFWRLESFYPATEIDCVHSLVFVSALCGCFVMTSLRRQKLNYGLLE